MWTGKEETRAHYANSITTVSCLQTTGSALFSLAKHVPSYSKYIQVSQTHSDSNFETDQNRGERIRNCISMKV